MYAIDFQSRKLQFCMKKIPQITPKLSKIREVSDVVTQILVNISSYFMGIHLDSTTKVGFSTSRYFGVIYSFVLKNSSKLHQNSRNKQNFPILDVLVSFRATI